jgi:peptidoglycan L-alanyl-D-glutamate endopeptidase CwlK
MTDMDRHRLSGVHPKLIAALVPIFQAMDAFGHPMFVTEGLRSTERQQELFAQGRTAPGNIVTYADGIEKRSNHQAKVDGFGHAVDCAFQGDDPWNEDHPWAVYGALVKASGLKWGGEFASLVDKPHAEL